MIKNAVIALLMMFVGANSAFAANVAKIGNTEYATFSAAYDAAQSGDTITLLSNVGYSGAFVPHKNLTIDGAGYTFKCNSKGSYNYFVNVSKGYTVKFCNITIDGNKQVPYVMQCIYNSDASSPKSKLELDNVVIRGGMSNSSALGYGIHNNSATVIANNLSIYDCDAIGIFLDRAKKNVLSYQDKPSVTLTGDRCDFNVEAVAYNSTPLTGISVGTLTVNVPGVYSYNLSCGLMSLKMYSSLPWNQSCERMIALCKKYSMGSAGDTLTVKLSENVTFPDETPFISNDKRLTVDGNNKVVKGTFVFGAEPAIVKNITLADGSILDCTASMTTGFSGVSVAANTAIDILLPASTDMNSYALPVSLATDAVANIFVGDKKYIAKNGVISSAEKLAQIGDKQYATLQEAIDAANGAVIQVLKDVALTSSLTVPAGKTLTLNLAGRKVTVSGADYALVNNGNLTIVDMGLVTVVAAEATIGDETAAPILIMAPFANDGVAVIDDATGGSIAGVQNNGTFALESGSVVAASASVPAIDNTANAVATITGGTVEGKLQSVDKTALTITGGSFTGESNVSEFVGGDYGVDSNGTIVKNVAKIGEVGYLTLEEAVAAATAGQTIVVVDNFDLGELTVNKEVTLDLNGQVITATGSYFFYLGPDAELTIKDSSETKTGTLKGVNADGTAGVGNAFLAYEGSILKIESGIIHAYNNVICTYGEGIVVDISGGELRSFLQEPAGAPLYLAGTQSEVTLTGGTFIGPIYNWNDKLSISGGQFTQDVSSYCASGLKSIYNEETGYFEVIEASIPTVDPSVAKARIAMNEGEKYYASVADALQAAVDAGLSTLELTLMGGSSASTTDCFDLMYGTAFDSVVFKQDQAGQPYYLACVYTGDRTAASGQFVFDGVNLVVTEQIFFECDVVLKNNSVLTRLADTKNFVYYGKLSIEPGSRFVSEIDDVMAGSLIVDGGKTDGTFCAESNYQSVFVDVRDEQTLTLKNGAYMLLNGGNENGTLALNGNATVTDSKMEVVNEITLGNNALLALNAGSRIETKVLKGAGVISIDAADLEGEAVVISAELSGFTGMVELLNNPIATYDITADGLVVKASTIAAIGEDQYGTLDAAFSAATNGATILMLCDAELPSVLAIAAGKKITLDLNGKIVSSLAQFSNAAELTVRDSSAEKTGEFNMAIVNSGKLQISSGFFGGDISGEGEFVVTGGTFVQDVAGWCAEGYSSVEQPQLEGDESFEILWKVGKLPSATVLNLGPTTVTSADFGSSYWEFDLVTGMKDGNKKDPFDLQVVLNFIAKDSPEQAAQSAYANYATDFRIKIEGMSSDSIIADEDCYLAGYYAGMWVKVALTNFKIENGVSYPVISALFPFTYEMICSGVKDFICGIHLSDKVLEENPDLKVSLDLGMTKTVEEMITGGNFIQVGETFDYKADEMRQPVAIIGSDYYTSVSDAVTAALETGDFIKLVADAGLAEDIAVGGDFVFNLGGKTLSADGKTLAITDSVVAITNGTLSGFTAANVTLAGNAVLTVTDKNVADSFRLSDSHYVSQNMNGTYSIMLKSAFRVFITVVDGSARIGFFKDCDAAYAPSYVLKAATNLTAPEWDNVEYVEADDAAGASELPLFWSSRNGGDGDYRFFKLQLEYKTAE